MILKFICNNEGLQTTWFYDNLSRVTYTRIKDSETQFYKKSIDSNFSSFNEEEKIIKINAKKEITNKDFDDEFIVLLGEKSTKCYLLNDKGTTVDRLV